MQLKLTRNLHQRLTQIIIRIAHNAADSCHYGGSNLNTIICDNLLKFRCNSTTTAQLAAQNYDILNKDFTFSYSLNGSTLTGQSFSSLPEDIQAQYLYVMHHEGSYYGSQFITNTMSDTRALYELQQNATTTWNVYIQSANGNAGAAYQTFLWQYTIQHIQPGQYH